MLTGNRDYNEIYEQYKNLVLKTAYIYSGRNYHAAEDITQDTFLKLYIAYGEMNRGKIPSWLIITARNAAINYNKKSDKEILQLDDEDFHYEEIETKSAEDEYIENELEMNRKDLHDRIFSELKEKNPRWHDAILLVYYMEVPQAKAAEMMGISLNVLHSILHRAKKWIGKTYGVEYEEMDSEDD